MGTPKALVEDWLRRSVEALIEGGCERVYVVLGAAADEAEGLLTGLDATVVVADDWADGMGASLRRGLSEIDGDVLINLVDLPDVGSDVVARVLAADADLARATYDGRPGHPVLIGSQHVDPLMRTLHGDVGARAYLDAHDVLAVECGDLASGQDRDTP